MQADTKRLPRKADLEHAATVMVPLVRKRTPRDPLMDHLRRRRLALRHRHQLAVRAVVDIDIELLLERQAVRRAHLLLRVVLARVHRDAVRGGGPQHRAHDGRVALHVEEQFAVGLDVVERYALGVQEGLERAYLV